MIPLLQINRQSKTEIWRTLRKLPSDDSPTSSSGHNHTQAMMKSWRTSSGGCLAAIEPGWDFIILMAGLEECINKWELLSRVPSCTVCQDCWIFPGWLVCSQCLYGSKRLDIWIPLKTQGPEFPRGRLKSSLSSICIVGELSSLVKWVVSVFCFGIFPDFDMKGMLLAYFFNYL